MLMRWSRDMPKAASQWDAIAAYLERMKPLKSFGLVHEREGLEIWPSARSSLTKVGVQYEDRYAQPAVRVQAVLPPSGSYLLASYCHAPILKKLLGSCFAFRARRRFMVSCGKTSSISASLSGMALFKYVVT
jgi:hypothetical protein